MRELSIEEKAKAYDDAKARMSRAYNENRCSIGFMNEIFPELKESKDEKIRKDLINYLKSVLSNKKYGDKFIEDWIVWLEKQGEQKPIDSTFEIKPKFKVGDTIRELETGNLFYVNSIEDFGYTLHYKNCNANGCTMSFKYEDNYELFEQKPADKAEPKFKVGDWINGYYTNYKVLSINNRGYMVEDVDGNKINILFENEKFHNLWTIKDAKDGDVLVNQNGEMPFIFKECKNNHIYCYCGYTNRKDIFFNRFVDSEGEELHWLNLYHEQAYPATKEQRDLLFQKMHEAGYEWDAEKKELKKIEQNPAWSEEDIELLNNTIKFIEDSIAATSPSLRTYSPTLTGKEIPFLKALKDRVLPKQEWSEEDDQYLLVCKNALAKYQVSDKWDATIISRWLEDKLKSLRPQNTWKPSDEQIIELRRVISGCSYDIEPLVEIEEHLKKLREE